MICKISHREATESGSEGFFQFVKFGIVGLSNTIISYLIYTFGLLGIRRIVSFRYDYLVAQVLAFVLSGAQRVLVLYLEQQNGVFSVSEFLAPLINLVITVPANFLINKYWTFQK